MIQLAASEFTERENGEFGMGRTVALLEFRIYRLKHTTDTNLGDLRKLPGGFLERRYVRKFPKRDSRHLAAFPKTKCSKIFFGDRGACEGAELVKHLSASASRATHFRLMKPKKNCGTTP